MDRSKRRKDYDYFQFFTEIARAANKAADHLAKTISGFDIEKLPQEVETMHRIENDADMMRHEMLTKLAHEFITPIDREDIAALAQQLDDVVDAIDDVMQRMYMYHVNAIRDDAIVFGEQIVKATRALLKAIEEFHRFKKSKELKGHCIEVNTIESDGDKMFAQSMRRLYTESAGDMMRVVVWSAMFEGMETCLDACEDAIDIVESVIMKNT